MMALHTEDVTCFENSYLPKVQDNELENLYNYIERYARKAQTNANNVERKIQIGEKTVLVKSTNQKLLDACTSAIKPIWIENNEVVDVVVECFDNSNTHLETFVPPINKKRTTRRGDVSGFNNERFSTFYSAYDKVFYFYDRERNKIFFWTSNSDFLPSYFLASPFRTIICWLLDEQHRQMLHAAGIGINGKGILLTGKSGSGKSTTSLNCLLSSFDFIGDDYVEVLIDSKPKMKRVFNSVKVVRERESEFKKLLNFSEVLVTPESEKYCLLLDKKKLKNFKVELPINSIFVSNVANREQTRIIPITCFEAARAIIPTTFSQLPCSGNRLLKLVQKLTLMVPCYRLDLGKDASSIPSELIDLTKQL